MGLETASLAMLGLGTGLQAGGAWAEGQAASDVALFNAGLEKKAAKMAINKGRLDVAKLKLEGSKLIGEQRRRLAGANISLESGTALEIQTDTAKQIELDAVRIGNNAALEAWGHKVAAASYKYDAKYQRKAGLTKGIGSLLTGAANTYGTGYEMGVFGKKDYTGSELGYQYPGGH